jgi:hypothetical protein
LRISIAFIVAFQHGDGERLEVGMRRRWLHNTEQTGLPSRDCQPAER